MKPWLLLAVIAAAAGMGLLLGLGSATVLAALPAMFCLMAAFGGTRHADLRLLAWFGPVLVLVVGGLKVLSGWAQWPGLVLVPVIVFIAGMLPVLGTRYVTVGMGLGMSATFGFGYPLIGPPNVLHDFAAPLVSVVVVVVARVLLGMRDPDGPLRAALSAALTSDDDLTGEQAIRQWQADGPRGWTTLAVGGIMRYRNAVRVLRTRRAMLSGDALTELDEVLAAAEQQARALGERLASPNGVASTSAEAAVQHGVGPTEARVVRREPRYPLPGATRELVTSAWLGLEAAHTASVDRVRSRVAPPPYAGREPLREVVGSALNWRSAQLRHAVRCALGMFVALLVSELWATSPLRLTFLMAVFAIMQPQLQDTIEKARQRVVGALAGAAVLTLVIVLADLPNAALVPMGVGAMLVGMVFFMQTKPVVFNGCVVLMSVGMNVSMRHLPLREALLEYLALMALAVVIAIGFGFLAVPGVRKVDLATRLDEALRDSRELLREVATALVTRNISVRRLRPRFRAATGAHQNLRSADAVSPTPSDASQQAAQRVADGLAGLSASASALVMRPAASAALVGAVGELARQLGRQPDSAAVFARVPAVIDAEQQLLLDTMIANAVAVSEAAGTLR